MDSTLPGGDVAPVDTGNGPIVGTIIIIVLLIFGALYFWGAQLNREEAPLPFIPGDATTTAQ